jgi:DNA-directed RNA polymerase subunit RPC12/RpoP
MIKFISNKEYTCRSCGNEIQSGDFAYTGDALESEDVEVDCENCNRLHDEETN